MPGVVSGLSTGLSDGVASGVGVGVVWVVVPEPELLLELPELPELLELPILVTRSRSLREMSSS